LTPDPAESEAYRDFLRDHPGVKCRDEDECTAGMRLWCRYRLCEERREDD